MFQPLIPSMIQRFQHIDVLKFTVRENGEISIESTEGNITWDCSRFRCNCSCDRTFQGFSNLVDHLLRINTYNVSCSICSKVSCGENVITSLINHTCRHYSFLKYCCLFCCKYFLNTPALSNHYLLEHPDYPVKIFPCFECGLYCQSKHHLRIHCRLHEKQNPPKIAH